MNWVMTVSALASSSGLNRRVDPAPIFPIERLGANLADLGCGSRGLFRPSGTDRGRLLRREPGRRTSCPSRALAGPAIIFELHIVSQRLAIPPVHSAHHAAPSRRWPCPCSCCAKQADLAPSPGRCDASDRRDPGPKSAGMPALVGLNKRLLQALLHDPESDRSSSIEYHEADSLARLLFHRRRCNGTVSSARNDV